MKDPDAFEQYDEYDAIDEPRSPLRQWVIRAVAALVLVGFVGGLYRGLLGILSPDDILLGAGIALGLFLLVAVAKAQRRESSPYDLEDPPRSDLQ